MTEILLIQVSGMKFIDFFFFFLVEKHEIYRSKNKIKYEIMNPFLFQL